MSVIPFPAPARKPLDAGVTRDLTGAFDLLMLAGWLAVSVSVFLVRF